MLCPDSLPAQAAAVTVHNRNAVPHLEPVSVPQGTQARGRTVTDSNGFFRIDSVDFGEYYVECNDRDSLGALVETRVSPGDTLIRVDAMLKPMGALRGRLDTAETRPIASFSVYIVQLDRALPVDAAGGFELSRIPPASYTLHVFDRDTLRVSFLDGMDITVDPGTCREIGAVGPKVVRIPVTDAAFPVKGPLSRFFSPLSDTAAVPGVKGIFQTAFSPVVAGNSKDTIAVRFRYEALTAGRTVAALGPVQILHAGTTTATMAVGPGSIGADTMFLINDTIRYSTIRSVYFDTGSRPLLIRLSNTMNGAVDSVWVTLLNLAPSPQPQAAGTLGPNETKTIRCPVAGKAIDSGRILIRVQGILKAPYAVAEGQGIICEYTLDSLLAARAEVMDSLVSFRKEFLNNLIISDTVSMDFADIRSGDFLYSLTNNTAMDLLVTPVHDHAWQGEECAKRNVQRVADLGVFSTPADSLLYFSGNIMPRGAVVGANTKNDLVRTGFSRVRVFPVWRDSKSVTVVRYVVKPATPAGKWTTVASGDSLVFSVTPIKVVFDKFLGTVLYACQRDCEPATVAVGFPGQEGVKQSLRDHFYFPRAYLKESVVVGLPPAQDTMYRPSIDRCMVRIEASCTVNGSAYVCSTFAAQNGLVQGGTFVDSLDITKILNAFPDSITVRKRFIVPEGTKMLVFNTMQDGGDTAGFGGMALNEYAGISLSSPGAPFYRDVLLAMGSGTFAVDTAARFFPALENPAASFVMKAVNRSDFFGTLHVLADPKKGRRDRIGAIDPAQAMALIENETGALDSGYIPLTGPQGVAIPSRDDMVNVLRQLTAKQRDLLRGADSASYRWFLKGGTPQGTSLNDTDNVSIKSWLQIQSN
jgi:hypothetical protein